MGVREVFFKAVSERGVDFGDGWREAGKGRKKTETYVNPRTLLRLKTSARITIGKKLVYPVQGG
jgi:hypothetical protein